MSEKDPLNEYLDLVPLEDGSHGVPTAENPAALTILPAHSDVYDHTDEDFTDARDTIDELLDQGMASFKEFAQIASQSQHPRAFEVLSTMMKTMSDLATAKLDAAEKRKKVKGMVNGKGSHDGGEHIGGDKIVNNTVFVGSTAALQKYLDENPGTGDTSTGDDE